MGSRCVRLRAACGLRDCAVPVFSMQAAGEGKRNISCFIHTDSSIAHAARRSPVVDEGVQVVEAAEQRVGHPAALRGAGAAAVEVSKSGDPVIRGNPASK